MISVIVFFLCFTLKKFELDLGMALGLFAIFGIIRYRTNTVDIKEMTYLFVVIGVSVINSLANGQMSYSEILSANAMIIFVLYLTELFWSSKHQVSREIVYEVIENIKPENHQLLKQDLESRTGLNIERIQIGNVDFLRDTAQITIYYLDVPKTN
jgi:Ca2+/Na+ antiporter